MKLTKRFPSRHHVCFRIGGYPLFGSFHGKPKGHAKPSWTNIWGAPNVLCLCFFCFFPHGPNCTFQPLLLTQQLKTATPQKKTQTSVQEPNGHANPQPPNHVQGTGGWGATCDLLKRHPPVDGSISPPLLPRPEDLLAAGVEAAHHEVLLVLPLPRVVEGPFPGPYLAYLCSFYFCLKGMISKI